MNVSIFRAFLALACAGVPSMGSGQLINERIVGAKRVCSYEATQVRVSGMERKNVEVRADDKCPKTALVEEGTGPAPVVAQLLSWTTEQGRRLCVYELGNQRWTVPIPIDSMCPIAAGLLPENPLDLEKP